MREDAGGLARVGREVVGKKPKRIRAVDRSQRYAPIIALMLTPSLRLLRHELSSHPRAAGVRS